MVGEIIIYCNDLEEANRELELLLRDRYSVAVERAGNIWDIYDGRIRLTAKFNRRLASETVSSRRKLLARVIAGSGRG